MTLRKAATEVFKLFALAVVTAAAIIFCFLITTGAVRAEPGDTYEVSIRQNRSFLVKAAGGRPSPPDLATAGGSYSGRPAECPPRAWCGCWLARRFGLSDRALWNARHWASIGRPAFPGCVGCVAVLKRGRGGHVGIVQGYGARGNPIILSGNHNNAVGVGIYPRARVLAYRSL